MTREIGINFPLPLKYPKLLPKSFPQPMQINSTRI